MRNTSTVGVLAACIAITCADAGLVNFNYTQSDATTGSGSIAPFSVMGHDFPSTPMPAASVFNPNTGTPPGFVGSIDAQAGLGNEPNEAVALRFSGSVTARSTDGFLIDIPLLFAPTQNAAPDVNDYTWNIRFGDAQANGVDTVSGSLRFALWLSRDDVIDGVETTSIFQRYTQSNYTFVTGQDTFTNADTVTAPIKDAFAAANRPLDFYWGWRDQGTLTSGSVLVDEFMVGGLLNADEATLRPVPEPSSVLLTFAGSTLLCVRRRCGSCACNNSFVPAKRCSP
jgi:hypothetical protein